MRPIDPWGGSYYVEWLTNELANRARKHIEEVEEAGGMAQAINEGIPKLRIEEAAARTQARIDSGRQPLVGVNKYVPDEVDTIEVLKVENSKVRKEQLEKLVRLRAERDPEAVEAALANLTRAAASTEGGMENNLPRPRCRRRPRDGYRRRDFPTPSKRCTDATRPRSAPSVVCTATRQER